MPKCVLTNRYCTSDQPMQLVHVSDQPTCTKPIRSSLYFSPFLTRRCYTGKIHWRVSEEVLKRVYCYMCCLLIPIRSCLYFSPFLTHSCCSTPTYTYCWYITLLPIRSTVVQQLVMVITSRPSSPICYIGVTA